MVTKLRTDGVRRRDSVGTGPVVLKVVSVTVVAFWGHGLFFLRLSFPTLTIDIVDICDTESSPGWHLLS